MLPGYNEDAKFDGKIYHVQTEDKGKNNPIIETLVYMKGTIVAARRRSYAKELEAGKPDKELFKILDTQHKQIKALVLRGQIDRINAQPAAAKPRPTQPAQQKPASPKPPSLPDFIRSAPPADAPPSALGSFSLGGGTSGILDLFNTPLAPESPPLSPEPLASQPPPSTLDLDAVPVYETDLELDEDVSIEPLRDEFLFNNFESFQQQSPMVQGKDIPGGGSGDLWSGDWAGGRSTYSGGYSAPASFTVEVVGNPELKSGQSASVRIMVVKKNYLPLKNADVSLRVVGSAFQTVALQERTGPGGVVSFSFTIPAVVQGTATVVVTASFENESAEKRLPVSLR